MLPRRGFVFFRSTLLPLVAIGAVGTTACSGGSSDPVTFDAAPIIPDAVPVPDAATIAPALFTPRDDLSDSELADQALALLGHGAPSGTSTCEDCHGLTKQRMRYWRAITDTGLESCFSDVGLETQAAAKAAIDCMRESEADDAQYHTENVAMFAAGAHLPWFEFAFRRAFGEDFEQEFEDFKMRVAMPRGEITPYTQEEFDVVASWFTRGVPLLDAKLPEDPRPTECLPGVSAAVGAHVAEMKVSGWRAVNEQNKMLMFGCEDGDATLDCLSTYPAASDASFSQNWAVNVPDQQVRVLRESNYVSSFWTRSSADGRFVANGASSGGASSRIVDLVRDVSIPGSAFYDPAFLPDNSGFMFQEGNAYLCEQSLLVSEPDNIDYPTDPACSTTANVGLYQHLGGALDSGDYWAVSGQFTSDNGGRSPENRDPRAQFSSGSDLDLTPLIHNGSGYESRPSISVETPYEGDAVISTGSRMVISRLRGPSERQLGFVMREVHATPSGDSYQVELEEVARYCFNGGKPAFSYDDRWLVLHHYIGDADAEELGFSGSDDPAFSAYASQAGANIYLIDTLTGESTRITHMQPGQYALFPHFRSDGWIYFIVRTLGQNTEHIVASDAALRLEGAEAAE